MTEDECLRLLAYVNISTYRRGVMEHLSRKKGDIPRDIAKAIGIRDNHISTTLRELVNYNLIECVNPEVRKGRLYRLTELGRKVMEYAETI